MVPELRAGDYREVIVREYRIIYRTTEEQVRIFEEELHIKAGEVDLSAFPLFSLFSLALGVTCVVPDMDATKPGAVDPRLIDLARGKI